MGLLHILYTNTSRTSLKEVLESKRYRITLHSNLMHVTSKIHDTTKVNCIYSIKLFMLSSSFKFHQVELCQGIKMIQPIDSPYTKHLTLLSSYSLNFYCSLFVIKMAFQFADTLQRLNRWSVNNNLKPVLIMNL